MRRAQITAQPFLIILGILIIACTFLLGYKALAKITSTVQESGAQTFLTTITDDIARYRAYGSASLPMKYRFPAGIQKICLFDSAYDPASAFCQGAHALECSAWEGGAGIFVIPPRDELPPAPPMRIAQGAICATGSITMTYTGVGDATKITLSP